MSKSRRKYPSPDIPKGNSWQDKTAKQQMRIKDALSRFIKGQLSEEELDFIDDGDYSNADDDFTSDE
jgi:hypothetical protein